MEDQITRLEAVATRLESLLSQTGGNKPATSNPAVPPAGAAPVDETKSASLQAYDDWIANSVDGFLKLSQQIGGDVQEISSLFMKAIAEQRLYIAMADKCAKPSDADLSNVIQPQQTAISAVQTFRESSRRSKNFNHLSAISEAIPALAWVCITPAPCPYIKEMKDTGIFYTNRILKEYKGKDETHVNWTKSFNGAIDDLHAYVKQHHTTGLTFKPNGIKASINLLKQTPCKPTKPGKSGGAVPPPPSGPAPPPPPPPPAMDDFNMNTSGGGDDSQKAASALFAEINKLGVGATAGLKKVPRDKDGNKIKPSGDVKAPKTKKPAASAPVKQQSATKPPVFECIGGKKWMVEYQSNVPEVFNIEVASPRQTIYLFKCEKVTVQISGKCNSITIDSCKKVNVVFDSSISELAIVNGQSITCQVTGKVPTIQCDKTDGLQMYLSKESLDCQIISAKSTAMNILVPGEEEGTFEEHALPEQFLSSFTGKGFKTNPVDHA